MSASVGLPKTLVTLRMLLNYAQAFAILAADIEKTRAQLLIGAFQDQNANLDPSSEKMQQLKRRVTDLLATCRQVKQLDRMHMPIGRLISRIETGMDTSELHHSIDSIQLQLFDELDRIHLYHVEDRLVPLYNEPAPFGEAVFNNLSSAGTDAVSAGRCLALGQPTASVFHLMRVMEVGLRALSKSLGIPYAPSWEAHLRQIKAKLEVTHAKKPKAWKKREVFYKEVMGDLEAIKLAWRNPTMHIVREFDQEQAENIYRSVRALMMKLAEQLKEPKRPVPAVFGVVE